jgi:hypothetical protein
VFYYSFKNVTVGGLVLFSEPSYICVCKCDMLYTIWLLILWLMNYACLLSR